MATRWCCGIVGLIVYGLALSGCSSCGSWCGRNSDCSPSWGKKSAMAPTQQGPLAGTYARPGNGTTTNSAMPQQIMQGTVQTPMVTSTPAQTLPSGSNPPMPPAAGVPGSPLNSSSIVPSNYQSPPVNPPGQIQMPPGGLVPSPDARMSAPPSVQFPAVNATSLDLTVPDSGSAKAAKAVDPKQSPTPMILPQSSASTGSMVISEPVVQAPSVAPPAEIKLPDVNNNGSQPPPLPPPPVPPTFGKN